MPFLPWHTVLNGFSAQAKAKAQLEHARSVKDPMDQFGGCFTCQIKYNNDRPCHPQCGNSGFSSCSVSLHQSYSCTNFHHKVGRIDWKKQHFCWPTNTGRYHFCRLPNNTAGYHSNWDSTYPGKHWFSDSALAAVWHVLNTPHIFKLLQNDLGFTPRADVNIDFAIWLTQYPIGQTQKTSDSWPCFHGSAANITHPFPSPRLYVHSLEMCYNFLQGMHESDSWLLEKCQLNLCKTFCNKR